MKFWNSFTRLGAIFSFAGACLAVTATPSHAVRLVVTNVNDAGIGSLRRAINEANKTPEPDRVEFEIPNNQKQSGIWVIKLQTPLPNITAPLRFYGPGQDLLTVRPVVKNSFPVFVVSGSVGTANSWLFGVSGMTIRGAGGGVQQPGAIQSVYARVSLSNCQFLNNLGYSGGAVQVRFGDLDATGCVFDGNEALTGGALHLYEGAAATVANCVFRNNSSTSNGDGGGAIGGKGTLVATDCTFRNNQSAAGSAINLQPYLLAPLNLPQVSKATITACTFDQNTQPSWVTTAQGSLYFKGTYGTVQRCRFTSNTCGAVRLVESTVTISRCAVTGNSATRTPGIYNLDSILNLYNCTIANNSSVTGGAALEMAKSSALKTATSTVVNCTLSHNADDWRQAPSEILVQSGKLNLLNTILNPAKDIGSLTVYSDVQVTATHNLASDKGGNGLPASNNLLNKDPLFATAGLRDNGGGTLTLALQSKSPAINAGDNSVLSGDYGFRWDQRGYQRQNGAKVDIGAFEWTSGLDANAASGASARSF